MSRLCKEKQSSSNFQLSRNASKSFGKTTQCIDWGFFGLKPPFSLRSAAAHRFAVTATRLVIGRVHRHLKAYPGRLKQSPFVALTAADSAGSGHLLLMRTTNQGATTPPAAACHDRYTHDRLRQHVPELCAPPAQVACTASELGSTWALVREFRKRKVTTAHLGTQGMTGRSLMWDAPERGGETKADMATIFCAQANAFMAMHRNRFPYARRRHARPN
jgi:hypothetical protein